MIINHNMASLNTYRQLSTNNANSAKSLEKLSSGLRINKAGDDAAGLAISEKMRGQIRGLDQAARNSQDAISMIQTAEGALTETHSILQRMRELATQSANGTNTDADRSRIQDEVNQLADEINRIGNTTEFNTQKLVNGSKDKTEATAATKNAASIANIGPAAADLFTVRSAATAGTAVGSNMTAAVTIHDGTSGKYTSGVSSALTNATTVLDGLIDNDHNELTIQIGNAVRTITLDPTAITNDGQAAAAIEAAMKTAFGAAPTGVPGNTGVYTGTAADITAQISGGKLVITDGGKGADSKISIVGGNAAPVLFNASDVAENGNAANNKLTVNYTKNGIDYSADLTLDNGTYNTPTLMAAQIETQFNAWAAGDGDAATDATDVNFTGAATIPGAISVDTTTTGKDNGVTSMTGVAAGLTGLSDAIITLGKAKNDELTLTVDGNSYTATIASTDYSDKKVLANAIQTAVNTQIQAWNTANPTLAQRQLVKVEALDVADTDRERFQITSGKTGAASEITFGATELASNLGFNTTQEKGKDGADASVSYHVGANKDQNLSLAIGDMRSKALGITGAATGKSTVTEIDTDVVDVNYGTSVVKNGSTSEYVIDVTSKDSANNAIEVINNAIEVVSKERSKLGAYQNRLEHTIANLGTSSENLTAAESRIRDVDMAKEMMNFQKNNILSQAAQAMLAQANQAPQGVLQLLR